MKKPHKKINNNKIMTLEFKKLDFIFFMWRRKISL